MNGMHERIRSEPVFVEHIAFFKKEMMLRSAKGGRYNALFKI